MIRTARNPIVKTSLEDSANAIAECSHTLQSTSQRTKTCPFIQSPLFELDIFFFFGGRFAERQNTLSNSRTNGALAVAASVVLWSMLISAERNTSKRKLMSWELEIHFSIRTFLLGGLIQIRRTILISKCSYYHLALARNLAKHALSYTAPE